ncbi:unnamed protein product [Musa hybrid cultivar]
MWRRAEALHHGFGRLVQEGDKHFFTEYSWPLQTSRKKTTGRTCQKGHSSCCSCSPFGWIDPVTSHPLAGESGGLSGKPLFDMSTSILKEMYILTQGKIPLIGCGGCLPKCSGEDAYKKIRAGATLVQLNTAFAYDGPSLIPQIKAELAECLERDGFKSVQEAVGADCK